MGTYVEFVQKGQIHNSFLSQNTFQEVYKLCTQYHAFIKKCTIICYVALLFW